MLGEQAMDTLQGKVAVVLGASSGAGFGAAIARRLAAEGARLVVSGRRAAELESVAKQIGGVGRTCDITAEADVAALFDETLESEGRVDVAVNAAGANHSCPISKLEPEAVMLQTRVHLLGTLLFIKHAARCMLTGGAAPGSIILISSLTATVPGPGLAAYSASKAGADHAARVAALEYGRKGIRVNCISPGLARTPMTAALFEHRGFEQAFVAETPLQRLATADDVAAAALWLATDAFVTGENIQVNGGASLGRLPTAREISGS